MWIVRWLAFSALLMTSVSGANAQDFDKGFAAYFSNDYQTALKELLPFAENGDVRAQTIIGSMYRDGEGVSQSDADSVKWFRLAADQSFSMAQCNLGLMYYNGKGVVQSYNEALKLYRLSADQGFSHCQVQLGTMYGQGIGVGEDFHEAVKWLRLAANQGDALGQYGTGLMFEFGKGVIQDSVRAHMWYNIAAANGEKNSATNRERVALNMTQEAIEKAQAMAQDCISSGYKSCGD